VKPPPPRTRAVFEGFLRRPFRLRGLDSMSTTSPIRAVFQGKRSSSTATFLVSRVGKPGETHPAPPFGSLSSPFPAAGGGRPGEPHLRPDALLAAAGRRLGERPACRRRRNRAGPLRQRPRPLTPPRLEHEAVHDLDRALATRP